MHTWYKYLPQSKHLLLRFWSNCTQGRAGQERHEDLFVDLDEAEVNDLEVIEKLRGKNNIS